MRTRSYCLTLCGLALAVLLGPALAHAVAQQQRPAHQQKVVVISLDAFAAISLHDPNLPAPTLHWLMKNGSYAEGLQPVNPTVTWPNHTAMVTGVDASGHHVIVNGLIVDQRTAAPPRVDANAPKSQLVAGPTIYDAAHQAGLTTAEVDWVAITGASTIDWRFSEKPDPDGAVARDLIGQGMISRDDLEHFSRPSQAWRDRIYTQAAVDIIRKHHPDLLLLHLLSLDSIEHKTGFGNDSGRNTIAFLDDRVKEVIEAVRSEGDFDRTTFIVLSDHGQQSVFKHLHANVLLQQAGLQRAATDGGTPAFCMSDGGFALVFQKNATPASRAALKRIFEGKPGIRAALLPEEAVKFGIPTPAQTDQAPDLFLFAAKGYAFTGEPSGEFVTDTKETGAHGYLNTEPKMQAIFIAFGAHIHPGVDLGSITNLRVAPTIAKILGISLPAAKQEPLTEALE